MREEEEQVAELLGPATAERVRDTGTEVSRENVELVRRLYGELASEGSTREFDQRLTDEALGHFLDPGIEWGPGGSLVACRRELSGL